VEYYDSNEVFKGSFYCNGYIVEDLSYEEMMKYGDNGFKLTYLSYR